MASVKKTQRGMEAHRAASASRAMRTGKDDPGGHKKFWDLSQLFISPIGSVELVSLLLVLVFSLAAVLLTSVLALNSQSQEIADLEAQVQVAQNR